MGEKGNVQIKLIPLIPKCDLVEIEGSYDELMSKDYYEKLNHKEDYYHITLTDENDVVDALSKLRCVYTNIMKLDYNNTRTRSALKVESVENVKEKSPTEIFGELYFKQNGSDMSKEQSEFLQGVIENVWEAEQ